MSGTVSKRYSNVRYWRYVFTPLVFLILGLGLLMLFTSDATMTSPLNTLTSSYRKNTMNLPLSGTNLGRR